MKNMDELHKQISMIYMNWLMQRVIDSGVKKEDGVKKAADIFMEDFKNFSEYLKKKELV